jgi:hypothetical protein
MIRLSKILRKWSGGGQANDLQQLTDLVNETVDEVNRHDRLIGQKSGSTAVLGLNVNGQPGILTTTGSFAALPTDVDESDLS